MFTGIVEELAKVENVQELDDFYTVKIASIFSDKMKVGDSIAINGVCLTATDLDNGCFIVDIVKETLDKSEYHDEKVHYTSSEGIQGLDKKRLIPALISAVQELSKKNTQLMKRVEELEDK